MTLQSDFDRVDAPRAKPDLAWNTNEAELKVRLARKINPRFKTKNKATPSEFMWWLFEASPRPQIARNFTPVAPSGAQHID